MVDVAVIPAAGRGTRLRPATTVIPKVMLPLIDTPVIQRVVEEALDAGVAHVVIVIGEDGDLIRRHFETLDGPWRGRLHWVEQSAPRGLGDAILCARGQVGAEPFAVLFGDSVFLDGNPTRALRDDFTAHGETVLAVARITPDEVTRRGVIAVESPEGDRPRVTGMVEKPSVGEAPSDWALVARAIMRPALFDALACVTPDASGEIQLTTAIDALAKREHIAALRISHSRLDIGNPRDYAHALQVAAERRAAE